MAEGRGLLSLFARPFVCECRNIPTIPFLRTIPGLPGSPTSLPHRVARKHLGATGRNPMPSPPYCGLDHSPSLADRFILGLAPFDYDPVVLLKPSGPRLAAGALPSRNFCNDGSRSAYLSPGFRRRASLASPYLSSLLADEALPPSLDINPGPRVEWDFNPPETCAAKRTIRVAPSLCSASVR